MGPCCIHFIWLQGRDHIPDSYRYNLASWERFAASQGHTIKVWDSQQISRLAQDKSQLRLYHSYPIFVQRADMGRYLILRKYGGIYLDIDTSIRPDQWASFQAQLDRVKPGYIGMPPPKGVPYFGLAPLDAVVRNWLIYSPTPGHPFFSKLLEEMEHRRHRKPTQLRCYYVAYSVGSVLISDLLRREQGGVFSVWVPLHIHEHMQNEYASSWGGTFYYDRQDWTLILGLALVLVTLLILVIVMWRFGWGGSQKLSSPKFSDSPQKTCHTDIPSAPLPAAVTSMVLINNCPSQARRDVLLVR